GILPSRHSIEGFRASTTNFFEENTKEIFEIDFDDISLTEIVQSEEVKKHLKEAENQLHENQTQEAIANVSLAFSKLKLEYHQKLHEAYGRSPYFFRGYSRYSSVNLREFREIGVWL
ncbi:MAG: hypothetical protein ACXAB2_05505, partial [Candidatus Hodarchaeales archaeon]